MVRFKSTSIHAAIVLAFSTIAITSNSAFAAPCPATSTSLTTLTSDCTALSWAGYSRSVVNNATISATSAPSVNIQNTDGTFTNNGTVQNIGQPGVFAFNLTSNTSTPTIVNNGTITSDATNLIAGSGLGTNGRVVLLQNNASGVMSALGSAAPVVIQANYGTIDNYGVMTSNYMVVWGQGAATALTNRAGAHMTSTGLAGSSSEVIYATPGSSIGTLTNDGYITQSGTGAATLYGIDISNATVPTLNNNSTGVISSGGNAINIVRSSGTAANITNLNNAGQITSSGFDAIYNNGFITTLSNTGSIVGGTGYSGINNLKTIANLYNAQGSGNTNGALTLSGNLPTTYKIILGSNASTYGQLAYQGGGTSTTLANFGIYGGTVSARLYTGVLSGVTAVANGTTGTYAGQNYQLALESGSTNIWDLLFPDPIPPAPTGPDAANTLTSVQMNAGGLAAMYNQQTAAYQAALTYDCQVYDENNMCVSVGGRYTYAGPSPSSNQQAGLVVLGYRPIPTVRVGAFADQSVNTTTPNGFKQNNNSPMWGLFAKWHMNADQTGLGVQASAVTSSSTLNVSRTQLTNTEAGSGTTQFNGQGFQLSTSYHQPVTDNTALVPYLGLRYTRVNAGAYTEQSSSTVTAPLSYNAMAQNSFSAIGGIGVKSHLAEKLTGTASVGIQQNLKYSMGNYQGTSSIAGLESFSVQMPGANNSMATATAGVYYDVRKNERLGLNVLWQQQPFIATNTTTALATYTIGF